MPLSMQNEINNKAASPMLLSIPPSEIDKLDANIRSEKLEHMLLIENYLIEPCMSENCSNIDLENNRVCYSYHLNKSRRRNPII